MELGLKIPFLSCLPALVSEQSKLYLIPSKETYPATLIMEVVDWNESGKEELVVFQVKTRQSAVASIFLFGLGKGKRFLVW